MIGTASPALSTSPPAEVSSTGGSRRRGFAVIATAPVVERRECPGCLEWRPGCVPVRSLHRRYLVPPKRRRPRPTGPVPLVDRGEVLDLQPVGLGHGDQVALVFH